MKSGTARRILSGVVAVAIAATLTVPAMAANTIKEDVSQPQEQTTTQPQSGSMDNFKSSSTYTGFQDVATSDWYYTAVKTCYELDLMKGNSATTFNPKGNVTLAQVITMAARVHKIYHEGTGDFESVGSKWYQAYADYALEQGIIKSGDFSDYDKTATRAEMAYVFANALPSTEYNSINNISELPDVGSSTKYSTQIFSLYNAGIIAGNDKYGTFNPNSNIQRSETVAIILRVVDKTERKILSLEPSVTVKPETPSTGSMVNAKGQMTHDYASQYILDSMKTVRVYKEYGKFYISCTLADLPEGFYWQPGADVYHDDDGYLFCTFDGDWVDSKGTIKIELEGVTSITDIAPVSFSLHIKSEENQGTTVSYKILSSYPGKIRMSSDEKGDKWIDYDTSAIFAGIK